MAGRRGEMKRVFANEHWILDRDKARGLLVARRTAVPYPSITAISKSFDALEAAMDACGRSRYSLLLDLREAPSRNDPEFERVTASHPRRFARDFIRAAVLVRTAHGMLQIRRTSGPLADRIPPFGTEAEAMAHLFPPAKDEKPPAAS
jgi:hypothetical protein